MLLDAHALESSEPRDKVFALQGTLARLGADLSCPDYSRSVETIYTEATTAAIKFDQNLSILAGLTGCRTCEGLPSWVPDWFNSGSMTEIASWDENKAAGAVPATTFRELDHGTRQLCLRGVIIDRVADIMLEYPSVKELDSDQNKAELQYACLRIPLDRDVVSQDAYLGFLETLCRRRWQDDPNGARLFSLKAALRRITGSS